MCLSPSRIPEPLRQILRKVFVSCVEEAIRSLAGIKRLRSIAREGGGYVIAELDADVPDPQKVVNEAARASNVSPISPNWQKTRKSNS